MELIPDSKFYCQNKDNYPPFKHGLYLEEYFLKYVHSNKIQSKRKYIPALWTNFQIESWFKPMKQQLQHHLNQWLLRNPSVHGYYTIVQYDDGPLLQLPPNTIVYGACSGNIPIPLIYEDSNNTLTSMPKKTFREKQKLCSFIGNITSNHVEPNVRKVMFDSLSGNSSFYMVNSGGWTPSVAANLQTIFINTTIDSKFALAPRGYGRSSFRFFECFQLGTIPVYLWNNVNWLPFQNIINYDKLCITLHISKINELETILNNISEEHYNSMWLYYNEIKHLFTLDGMTRQIISEISL